MARSGDMDEKLYGEHYFRIRKCQCGWREAIRNTDRFLQPSSDGIWIPKSARVCKSTISHIAVMMYTAGAMKDGDQMPEPKYSIVIPKCK